MHTDLSVCRCPVNRFYEKLCASAYMQTYTCIVKCYNSKKKNTFYYLLILFFMQKWQNITEGPADCFFFFVISIIRSSLSSGGRKGCGWSLSQKQMKGPFNGQLIFFQPQYSPCFVFSLPLELVQKLSNATTFAFESKKTENMHLKCCRSP